MSIGILGGIAAGAVGSAINAGIDYGFSSLNWNKQKQYEQETYNRNRADYLSDLANERKYNSPQEIINRIREAGLNPNLINGGQLVSAQASSGTQPMSLGQSMSPDPVTSQPIASGIPAFADSVTRARKADSEIAQIKLSNEYKSIEIAYLRLEKELGLQKTAAQINESIANIQKKLSDITVNNSTIEINGKRIDLISSQIDKNVKEAALIHAKTIVENLNADKLRKILPYVQQMQESELALKTAHRDLAIEQCVLTSRQAELAFVEQLKVQGLLDAGYCDVVIAEMNARIGNTTEDTQYIGHRAKSQRRSANAQIVQGAASLITSLAIAGASGVNGYNALTGAKGANTYNIGVNPMFVGGGIYGY